jgi:hypothetical protein
MQLIQIALVSAILSRFLTRFALYAETVALRHQPDVMRRSIPKPSRLHI